MPGQHSRQNFYIRHMVNDSFGMLDLVHRYFAVHRSVVLPGIGSFIAETQKAKLDFVEKTLHAPTYSIRYDTYDTPEDSFYIFLARETGERDPVDHFKSFSSELKQRLESDHIVTLPGIGILTKNGFGYSFVADNTVQTYYPSVTAERAIRQNAEHMVKVGEDEKTSTQMHEHFRTRDVRQDKWYVAALILGTIGILAIAFYYVIKQ